MTASDRPRLGAILLAAGGSTRLGRPKQLVKFEGESLLRRSARSLAASVYFPVLVVLGADADVTGNETEGLPVYSIVNERWREGMSSSIRTGLGRLLEIEPRLDGVLITVCDQPQISSEVLNRFASALSEGEFAVIAAAYDGTAGVPALFGREMFTSLMDLEGDKGARDLIRGRDDTFLIDLPEAALDIDTVADADRLS